MIVLRTNIAQSFSCPLAIACTLILWLAGCWRDSPPEIQEFRPPAVHVVEEAPATQPATQPATVVAEAPKVEETPEVKPAPVKAPATVVAEAPSEPVKEVPKAPTIIGTWRLTKANEGGQMHELPAGMEMKFTFNEDGSLTMSQSFQGQSNDMSGTYTLSGSQITMTIMGRTVSGTVTFNGDSEMNLDIENKQAVLTRA